MAQLIYDEWYGELTRSQRAAYRKYNVSPLDHQMLEAEFGVENHAEITKAVKERSADGMYRAPSPW